MTQMTLNKDTLDAAIDRVASRMTAVDADDLMTERIVAALPERSPLTAWLMGAWAPRLAAVALVVIGAGLWNRNGIERPDPAAVLTPSIDPALVAFAPAVVPNRPITRPLERVEHLEPLEPTEARVDFDRSLPALEGMATLSLSSLAPRELPERNTLGLAPIEIGELALTTESFPQRH